MLENIDALIIRYERCIHFTLHKYFYQLINDEDAFQILRIELWKTIERKYKEIAVDKNDENGFVNYLITCLQNCCRNYIRTENRGKRRINKNCKELDAPIGARTIGGCKKLICDYDGLRARLTEKENLVLSYLQKGYSLKEINDLTNTKTAYNVKERIRKKAIDYLYEEYI